MVPLRRIQSLTICRQRSLASLATFALKAALLLLVLARVRSADTVPRRATPGCCVQNGTCAVPRQGILNPRLVQRARSILGWASGIARTVYKEVSARGSDYVCQSHARAVTFVRIADSRVRTLFALRDKSAMRDAPRVWSQSCATQSDTPKKRT